MSFNTTTEFPASSIPSPEASQPQPLPGQRDRVIEQMVGLISLQPPQPASAACTGSGVPGKGAQHL